MTFALRPLAAFLDSPADLIESLRVAASRLHAQVGNMILLAANTMTKCTATAANLAWSSTCFETSPSRFERIGAAMSAASDSDHEVKRAAEDQGRIAATANSRLIGVQRKAAETAKDGA